MPACHQLRRQFCFGPPPLSLQLVSPSAQAPMSAFEMVHNCTPAGQHRVNLQLTRYHVVASVWPNRTLPELPLWLTSNLTASPAGQAPHPLYQ